LAVVLTVDRMFVRVKKIGKYEYLYLVENAREGGRHVQRTVKALGRREEVEASGMLDSLVASAARHSRRSIVLSVSGRRRYGLTRVCRVWGVARAGVYRRRRATNLPAPPRRRPGPQGPMPDAALVGEIRAVLAESPFHGEGHRKVWARLRHRGVRTSKERVRRLMRANQLSAGAGRAAPRGPQALDGTIIHETVDAMGGTDTTAALATGHGEVAVFVALDHRAAECVGIHPAIHGTRHEALEPIRQGVRARFGAIGQGIASGLSTRHDHGRQYMAHDFEAEIAWLGAASAPAFVRAPEGNGCARRFIRTLKENLPPGARVPHRRGSPAGAARVQGNLQRAPADRAARTPLASPAPPRPDGQSGHRRIAAIGCLRNRGGAAGWAGPGFSVMGDARNLVDRAALRPSPSIADRVDLIEALRVELDANNEAVCRNRNARLCTIEVTILATPPETLDDAAALARLPRRHGQA